MQVQYIYVNKQFYWILYYKVLVSVFFFLNMVHLEVWVTVGISGRLFPGVSLCPALRLDCQHHA